MLGDITHFTKNDMLKFDEFRSIRAKYLYAAFSTAPDTLVFVANLSQQPEKRYEVYKEEVMNLLLKLQKVLMSSPSIDGLKYIKMEP